MKRNVKGAGVLLMAAFTLIILATMVLYLAFAGSSGTFNAKIPAAFLVTIVCGVALFLSENRFSDYLVILANAIASVALALFILDSVGDFTDFFSGIVMYGNPKNVPMRGVIIGIHLVGILVGIIGSFLRREKAN